MTKKGIIKMDITNSTKRKMNRLVIKKNFFVGRELRKIQILTMNLT